MPDRDVTRDPFDPELDDHVGLVDARLRIGSGVVVDLDREHPAIEKLRIVDR